MRSPLASPHDHNYEDKLQQFLHNRHPDWVMLSSPYRPVEPPLSLQEVHLSHWFHQERI
ncbi:hypothetical protein [Thermicanus aegyptius]|uniref:hypothetical protein n=1 Tax=Thermicanus aegyptius TaxID=94009 RepID=UPI00034AA8AC|nr:hypothetical protein [Thermicanus aegyptius]